MTPPPGQFRHVLGHFASGVTVVTGLDEAGEPQGLTCQAFASVSLDPPLVLFCAATTSRSWPLIRAGGTFCVNLLAHDQAEVAEVMAVRGADKFAGLTWQPAPATGSPLLAGVLGYVDCSLEAVHDAGDHEIVVGRVQALDVSGEPADPLVRFSGRYLEIVQTL
ncbi:flavin reductase [Nocardioides mangrovicus]|uniref:Flavin reductase n=1 Tax=Nocardioides mangrovicus TaxID=2478913 RepID=A0A3L8P1I4_9ACTN|nr:flavin reductase family protein [Nocardioides mangrovicus]RLV49310.1 flavin reductase [Nocardioides mangrovicus]